MSPSGLQITQELALSCQPRDPSEHWAARRAVHRTTLNLAVLAQCDPSDPADSPIGPHSALLLTLLGDWQRSQLEPLTLYPATLALDSLCWQTPSTTPPPEGPVWLHLLLSPEQAVPLCLPLEIRPSPGAQGHTLCHATLTELPESWQDAWGRLLFGLHRQALSEQRASAKKTRD